MGDKINFDDYGDLECEPSDSEDEYTNKEKELLKNVRQRSKKKNVREEVLGFDESDEDDDDDDDDNFNNNEDDDDDDNENVIDNSDLEDDRNNDDIPDSRAWGKKRSAYYHTDFVDQDYSTYNEKDEELALQEEEEAKCIQQRLAKQLDEIDFSLDVYIDIPVDEHTTLDNEKDTTNLIETKLKLDIESFTERQKEELFKKDSPEFYGLIKDFDKYLEESQKVLQPFLESIKKYDIKSPIIQFIETMNNVIFTYCTNITFYILLKTKRISVKNHPIIKRLVQIRKILQQLEEKYNDVIKMEAIKFIEMIQSDKEIIFNTSTLENVKEKSKKSNNKKTSVTFVEDENDFDYNNTSGIDENENVTDDDDDEKVANEDKEEEENEDDETESDSRRAITYQIAKNKGLTPYRKKELRNPRVKHRNKYRKALIRRKGAVRTIRKEIKRYDGEISGIKATVKKSVKIKN